MSSRSLIHVLVAVGLIAGAVAAYSLGVIARGGTALHGTELAQPREVGELRLEGRQGPVRLADYRGRHLVVFFGYTDCPDVCPLTMAALGRTYRELGEPEDVQVVMVTVDPHNDSPAVVDRYAKGFHPDFVGLGGDAEAVDEAAARFMIGHRHDGHGGVLHGSQVLLVDPAGRFHRIYNDEALPGLASDLMTLMGG